MLDIIKKTMYTGLGLAFMTKSRIEDLSREMVKAGKLSEKEGKELFDEMTKKSEEAGREVRSQVDSTVKDVLRNMDVVTREDLEKIENQLDELKKKVRALEKESNETAGE